MSIETGDNGNNTAVDESVEIPSNFLEHAILVPYEGQRFVTSTDAQRFYNMFAYNSGFGTRQENKSTLVGTISAYEFVYNWQVIFSLPFLCPFMPIVLD